MSETQSSLIMATNAARIKLSSAREPIQLFPKFLLFYISISVMHFIVKLGIVML